MKIFVDSEFEKFGISHVVGASLLGLTIDSPLREEDKVYIKEAESQALSMSKEDLSMNWVLEGYRNLIRTAGRSVKKFEPSAQTLINGIQRKGSFPKINSFVDIYNASAVKNLLSIGAHDADTIRGEVSFCFSKEEGVFIPIGGNEKHVGIGDFFYGDDKGIIAWMGVRDAEAYKITNETKNVMLFIIGSADTSVEYREDALKKLCSRLTGVCGGEYTVFSVPRGKTAEV